MAHTRIYYEVLGGHVHTTWWSGKGKDYVHGKNGDLVFTIDEWENLKNMFETMGIPTADTDRFELVESNKESSCTG